MRLFIGVRPGKYAQRELMRLLSELKKQGGGNMSREDNLHLTLAFLGETVEERIPAVKAAMDGVSVSPFSLALGELGSFKGNVVWCGVGGETEKLAELYRELSQGLNNAGFATEGHFSPHITLSRGMKEYKPLEVRGAAFTVGSLILFHSTRVEGVLRYIPIYERKL